jgi:hypothetical protein
MENVGIFYNRLVYFTAIETILWPFCIFCGHFVYVVAILYILWPFGIFCGHLVYFVAIWYIFTPFWTVVPRKIWQPWFYQIQIHLSVKGKFLAIVFFVHVLLQMCAQISWLLTYFTEKVGSKLDRIWIGLRFGRFLFQATSGHIVK